MGKPMGSMEDVRADRLGDLCSGRLGDRLLVSYDLRVCRMAEVHNKNRFLGKRCRKEGNMEKISLENELKNNA